jgi:hypothetical protein
VSRSQADDKASAATCHSRPDGGAKRELDGEPASQPAKALSAECADDGSRLITGTCPARDALPPANTPPVARDAKIFGRLDQEGAHVAHSSRPVAKAEHMGLCSA